VKAAGIFTLFDTSIIRPSLHLRRHPCGISDWATLVTQLLLSFYKIFLFNVIKLMLTYVHLAGWANITVYHSLIQQQSLSFPFSLFTQMFGLHPYLVTLVLNTMLFF